MSYLLCCDLISYGLILLGSVNIEVFFIEVKRPGREADHSCPSVAQVKNYWDRFPIPVFLDGTYRLHGHDFNSHYNKISR